MAQRLKSLGLRAKDRYPLVLNPHASVLSIANLKYEFFVEGCAEYSPQPKIHTLTQQCPVLERRLFVISLKDSWQLQRQQRQHEVRQRQHQVRQILNEFHQERLTKATKLRHHLNCFQLELQNETQDFLVRVAAQRHIQAQQLTQQLHDFTQMLQRQTAQLMATNAADRALMAQQLFHNLAEFHASLAALVSTLQQEMKARIQQIQGEVRSLQTSTQQMLKFMHEQRIQDQIRLMQSLSSYVTALQFEVRDYLTEMEVIRHIRTHQLQQMLQQEHNRRLADMKNLFQQLSEFRAELRSFCQSLHETVWGTTPLQGMVSAQRPIVGADRPTTTMTLGTLTPKSVKSQAKPTLTAAVVSS